MPFSRIVGHKHIASLLMRALEAGKLSHAYLFDGIDGLGMKDTALALVEAVFCNGRDGCGTCSSCRKVGGLRHPDLHLVQPDGAFIKIDRIRELQKELSLRPYEARTKACIIEDAERMNPSAANAFLKTLEEPPGEALLILLTTHADGILPTIRSRCQRLRFPALPMETIEADLRERGAEPESSRVAAALAGGDLARARRLVSGDRLQVRKLFLERAAHLSGNDVTQLFAAAEEYATDKESALELLDLLRLFWRDVLLLRTGSPGITNSDILPLVNEKANTHSLDEVMEKLECISRIGNALARNANHRLSLEVLFMELADA
ncbi:MAG: DNA polymerase III subunit delta' [Geobacteraceae bacterium]|nr:DNA polymerase III subunit delta' [Geobacteraceae bacterium]